MFKKEKKKKICIYKVPQLKSGIHQLARVMSFIMYFYLLFLFLLCGCVSQYLRRMNLKVGGKKPRWDPVPPDEQTQTKVTSNTPDVSPFYSTSLRHTQECELKPPPLIFPPSS
ncbi:hypothetical protein JOB18_009921 [Solea senegalensis]|uniref:Transmembrane protein n=1 Tax=Solea senegalensis TaxID=28829 RepID=A0AAV6RB45_SOLSE|nr:hypothetical protein JOB18_009921 [Solea senegalensis]